MLRIRFRIDTFKKVIKANNTLCSEEQLHGIESVEINHRKQRNNIIFRPKPLRFITKPCYTDKVNLQTKRGVCFELG